VFTRIVNALLYQGLAVRVNQNQQSRTIPALYAIIASMNQYNFDDNYGENHPVDTIYSVSQLNGEAKVLLESNFPSIWVEGEISNLARPSSGHIYFSLKDDSAQVRCAMFRGNNQRLRFNPEHGMLVKVRARVSLYPGRGDFQLIVDSMEKAGTGALQQAYERLKQKLHSEGLFDSEHKQKWPKIPQQIGVITSPTGAALRDILSVLKRRFPLTPVILYPTPVQGEGSGAKIAHAINTAGQRNECDVLILSRGGGSLEDLWAFNEEVVARAIFNCHIPLICGVGHEVDFTIADFVADERAPTPSAAAELITPDQNTLHQQLRLTAQTLIAKMKGLLETPQQRIDWLERRLAQRHPGQWLSQQQQRLLELKQRLANAQRNIQRHCNERAIALKKRAMQQNPRYQLQHWRSQQQSLSSRLYLACQQQLKSAKQRFQHASHNLGTVSPLATLGRGYAIVTQANSNQVISDAATVQTGSEIDARLSQGSLRCKVLRQTLKQP